MVVFTKVTIKKKEDQKVFLQISRWLGLRSATYTIKMAVHWFHTFQLHF